MLPLSRQFVVVGALLVDGRDIRSYEYGSATRVEQYFGEMHWAIAWPLLQKRVGGNTGLARTASQGKR